MQVCDVGGGTGFCTLGVVEKVNPENVTLVDQSPHQLSKAKAKAALQKVAIKEVASPFSFNIRHLLIKKAVVHQQDFQNLPFWSHDMQYRGDSNRLGIVAASLYAWCYRVMQRIYHCPRTALTGMSQQEALSTGQIHSEASGKHIGW